MVMNDREIELTIKNARLEAAIELLRKMALDDKARRASKEAMLDQLEINNVLMVAGLDPIE